MLSVEVKNIDEVNKKLSALPKESQRRALLFISQAVYEKAIEGADKHTKTGHMARSTYNRKISDTTRHIGHDAPYSIFVHWGTKPHIIRPVHKKALRWPNGNGFAFAKSVQHPGYAGDRWLERAADYALRNFDQLVSRALNGILK